MAKQYEVTPGKKVVSRITSVMARWGMGHFVVVTTTGRHSGKPREVTTSPIQHEGVDYLVSPYGKVSWVQNVRAHPQVEIAQAGEARPARLVEVENPEVVKAYYEREAFARQYMEVPGDGTVADFASVPGRFPVFRIEYQD